MFHYHRIYIYSSYILYQFVPKNAYNNSMLKESVHLRKLYITFNWFEIGFWLKLIRMQNKY